MINRRVKICKTRLRNPSLRSGVVPVPEAICSIPVPQSELGQSMVGLIRRTDMLDMSSGWKMAGTVTKLPEQLQDGSGWLQDCLTDWEGVTGETVKDGYGLIRNRPRAVTDGIKCGRS
ncbi:hypothetical protein DY000_02006402 [Brassica cretica]|uniref:Uncharacterized protein n=1 Tax=Brassica cretica TaxID=69181 RepID=A0ABQ7CF33_BRACR|nr:hypothetical protein DY000_02006402 [Brassica cretica]